MRRVVAPSRRAVRAQRAEERRDARRGRPLASRVRVAEWRYPVARVPRRDVRVPRDPECGAFSMFDRPPGPVRAAGAWTWPPCAASSCGAPRRIASLREAPRARRAFAAYELRPHVGDGLPFVERGGSSYRIEGVARSRPVKRRPQDAWFQREFGTSRRCNQPSPRRRRDPAALVRAPCLAASRTVRFTHRRSGTSTG